MKSLPAEVYLQIFQLLNKHSLKYCITICKEWTPLVLQIYYQTIKIDEHNTKIIKSQLEEEETYFKQGIWVKQVSFSHKEPTIFSLDESDPSLTKTEFLKFLTFLPNLKKIKINLEGSLYKYFKYLLDINTDKYLTQLEEIKVEKSGLGPKPDLCSLYYKFRNSIQHAIILNGSYSIVSTEYGGILNYLEKFKKLSRLVYRNDTRENVTLYDLQASCPTLTCIKLESSYTIPQYLASDDTFYYQSNLKELKLSFPNISASDVDFLTNHLPESVEKLYITLNDITLFDWVEQVGMKNISSLADRMSKLPCASIQCTPDKKYQQKSEETSNMEVFFKVLNNFKGDKKVFCSAEFSDFRSVHHTMNFDNNILSFSYGLNHLDFYPDHHLDPKIHAPELVVPHKSLSIIGPEIINSIRFHICATNDAFAYQLLKYCFQNCPYLQFAEYTSMNHPRREFHLRCFPRQSFYDNKLVKDPTNPTTSEENIKSIQLGGFIPSKEHLEILSNYLPNINTIACEGDPYGCYKLMNKTNRNSILDLSNFKNLDIIYFDMSLVLGPNNPGTCIIAFEFIDQEIIYYEYKEEDDDDLEFKVIPMHLLQEKQKKKLIPTITFKCEKIMQFTIYNTMSCHIIEFLNGQLQKPRFIEQNDFKNARF